MTMDHSQTTPVRNGDSGTEHHDDGVWRLRLYVAGRTPKSATALENLRRFCDEHMAGRYEIEVIDLVENPRLAKDDQIVALPTLVRKLPEPLRRIIGTLGDAERLLVGLDLKRKA